MINKSFPLLLAITLILAMLFTGCDMPIGQGVSNPDMGTGGGTSTLEVQLEELSGQSNFSPFKVETTPNGGKYIVVPNGTGMLHYPSNNATGQVKVGFSLSNTGDVKFKIQAYFPNYNDDSFYYKLDSGPWQTQNNFKSGSWFGPITVKTFAGVSAGDHTLTILRREDGAMMDKVMLTSSTGSISDVSSGGGMLEVQLEELSEQSDFSPFKVESNWNGDKYIVVPNGVGMLHSPSNNATGRVKVGFSLSNTTDVKFKIQAYFPNYNDDSFYYKLDSGPWHTQNNAVSGSWFGPITVKTFAGVSAGDHTLTILRREDGAMLDKVMLISSTGTISNTSPPPADDTEPPPADEPEPPPADDPKPPPVDEPEPPPADDPEPQPTDKFWYDGKLYPNSYLSTWGFGTAEDSYVHSDRTYNWYIDQRYTGAASNNNCGPTSVTMAIKWFNSSFSQTVEDARNWSYGQRKNGWWYTEDIIEYLNRHSVPNTTSSYTGPGQLQGLISEGNIIILCINSGKLPRNTNSVQRIGRFYDYADGHFLVVKGARSVSGRLLIEVYDPNTWGQTYADGSQKGKNRHHLGTNLTRAIETWWDYIIVVSPPSGGGDGAGQVPHAASKWLVPVDPSTIEHQWGK